MSVQIKIKPLYSNTIIAFGGGGKTPLKDRTQIELTKLAADGLSSQDKTILNLFEGELPSLPELQKKLTEHELTKK